MKQDASFFDGHEAVLVFIAKKLKDAVRLEEVLTAAGIDFGVEADEYRGGVVFQSNRIGAFFYVRPDAVEAAHGTLVTAGYKPYVEPASKP